MWPKAKKKQLLLHWSVEVRVQKRCGRGLTEHRDSQWPSGGGNVAHSIYCLILPAEINSEPRGTSHGVQRQARSSNLSPLMPWTPEVFVTTKACTLTGLESSVENFYCVAPEKESSMDCDHPGSGCTASLWDHDRAGPEWEPSSFSSNMLNSENHLNGSA
jgi:hypothetical protein